MTVDLVLPKQSSPTLLDASMPRRQTQLRQKLADRHPKVREKAKSAAVQLNQWSLMDPKRDNWKSWKAIVERACEYLVNLGWEADEPKFCCAKPGS